jgi:hypothetical protein
MTEPEESWINPPARTRSWLRFRLSVTFEESARAIFARQLEVHCAVKFRLVNPAGRTVEFEVARMLFAVA